MFEFGMKEHERREKELSEFQACIEDTKNENKNSSAKLIDLFEDYRKRVGFIMLKISAIAFELVLKNVFDSGDMAGYHILLGTFILSNV